MDIIKSFYGCVWWPFLQGKLLPFVIFRCGACWRMETETIQTTWNVLEDKQFELWHASFFACLFLFICFFLAENQR